MISFSQLSACLQNGILYDGTDLDLTGSFIRYLTDLKILSFSPPDNYYIPSKPNTILNETLTTDTFLSILQKESETKSGFAIGYFLRSNLKKYSPKNPPDIFQDKLVLKNIRRIFRRIFF